MSVDVPRTGDLRSRPLSSGAGLAIAVGLVGAITMLDLVLGDRTVPVTALVFGPLVACSFCSARTTGLLGVGAFVLGVLLGKVDGLWASGDLIGRLVVIGVGAGIAVLLAAERIRRESALVQMKKEETSRESAHLVREAAIESTGRAREASLVEAQVVDRAEMMAEIALVRQLQANLLPRSLPDVASVELSAHYESADDRVEIGGDWYDAFPVDAEHLGISIGDVSGHGIEAASLMAHARLSLQLAVLGGSGPGAALRQLDAVLACVSSGTEFATAVVGIYSLADHVFWWARAGHCFPVLRTGDGSTALTGRGGPPVGVGLVTDDFPEHRTPLAPGDVILLYTDGLVERRRRPVTEGTDALTELVQAWDGEQLDGLVRSLPAQLSLTEPSEDDICLLAIRRATDTPSTTRPLAPEVLLDA